MLTIDLNLWGLSVSKSKMDISYEFEGHKLTDWAEFGGLPVWVNHSAIGGPYPARVYAQSPTGRWCVWWKDPCNESSFISTETSSIELRYSKLEDVIDQKPEWADWIIPYNFDGEENMFSWSEDEQGTGEHLLIKGHLFNPEDYPEPVEVSQCQS